MFESLIYSFISVCGGRKCEFFIKKLSETSPRLSYELVYSARHFHELNFLFGITAGNFHFVEFTFEQHSQDTLC